MSILLDKRSLVSVSISCFSWSCADERAAGAFAIEPPPADARTKTLDAANNSIVITMGWTNRSPLYFHIRLDYTF